MSAASPSSDDTHHTSQDDYVEQVLGVVESIPPGKVLTYGDVAELVGRGGPRQVGAVMSRHGAGVPWWRVLRADGSTAAGLAERALARLRQEGAPLRGGRVDLRHGRWQPLPTDGVGEGFPTRPDL